MVITGEIGCGKTTIGRAFLQKIEGRARCAFITNTHLSPKGMIHLMLEELEVPYKPASKEKLILQLNEYLLQQLREDINVVVVVDEAQNLTPVCLEEIRMLSNLETEKEKLIQIVLMGQPELSAKLRLPSLAQLRQRVYVFYHLGPLDLEETQSYILHRLGKVLSNGQAAADYFDMDCFELIQKISCGVPRLINMICDHSLLTAYVLNLKRVDSGIIREAAADLQIKDMGNYEQIYQSA